MRQKEYRQFGLIMWLIFGLFLLLMNIMAGIMWIASAYFFNTFCIGEKK